MFEWKKKEHGVKDHWAKAEITGILRKFCMLFPYFYNFPTNHSNWLVEGFRSYF